MSNLATPEPAPPVFVIEPSAGWSLLNLRAVWEFRDLLAILVWRDIAVRYKQTVIGVAWVVLQPLTAMALFSVIFGRLGRLPSDGVPYPLFAFAGLLPWQFFSRALTEASTSLVVNERLITKVYFPRVLMPTAVILSGVVDFLIGAVLFLGILAFYAVAPSWRMLCVPFFFLLMAATALGTGFWLSCLDVQYRDVRYTLPFLTQLWLYASPVAYSSSLIPAEWRWLYGLNPMVGVLDGFRWALLAGYPAPHPASLAVSCLVVTVLLVTGLAYFRHVERTLADHL